MRLSYSVLAAAAALLVWLARATPQCFEGSVTLTSSRVSSPCVAPSCTMDFSVKMDLYTRELLAFGIDFPGAPDQCLGELTEHIDYSFDCHEIPGGGGMVTVTIVARIDFDDGFAYLSWRYSGIALSCDAFNTTLTPVGATLQAFDVFVQPPPGDEAELVFNSVLNNAYSLATLEISPCSGLTTTCLVPPQRCYRTGDVLALTSGPQPGANKACSQKPGYCDVFYQFRITAFVVNSTSGLLHYDVEELEYNYIGQEGWLDYCLSNMVPTLQTNAAYSCTNFTSSGDYIVELEVASTQITLQWLYNLDNETLECDDALFAPSQLTAVNGYTLGTDITYLDSMQLTDGGTSQWIDSSSGLCSVGGNNTGYPCLVVGDCTLIYGGGATCDLRSDELHLFEIPCSTFVEPNCVPSVTPTKSPTGTVTQTNTQSGTRSQTGTRTSSPTPTGTPSETPTVSQSNTPTRTETTSVTATRSITLSPTASITASSTNTPTKTSTVTPSTSRSNTVTPTNSKTGTPTASVTRSPTSAVTPSISLSRTSSQTPSVSKSSSQTPSLGYKKPGAKVPAGWRLAAILLSVGAAVLCAIVVAGAPVVYAVRRAQDEAERERRREAEFDPTVVPPTQTQVMEQEMSDVTPLRRPLLPLSGLQ